MTNPTGLLDAFLEALWRMPLWQASLCALGWNVLMFAGVLATGWALLPRLAGHRVTAEPPPRTLREVALAGLCLLLNTVVTAVGIVLWKRGFIRVAQGSALRGLLDCLVLLAGMDLGMYVTHRIAHHRWLYPYVHATHHAYPHPRPLTLFVLNPFEVLGFGGLWLTVLCIYSASALGIVLYLILNAVFGFLGHLGVEPFPPGWVRWPLTRHITTSTFHALHHVDPEHNFGFYTTIWDRLSRTLSAEYVQTFSRAARGSAMSPE